MKLWLELSFLIQARLILLGENICLNRRKFLLTQATSNDGAAVATLALKDGKPVFVMAEGDRSVVRDEGLYALLADPKKIKKIVRHGGNGMPSVHLVTFRSIKKNMGKTRYCRRFDGHSIT